jgi:putative transposase
MKTPTRMYVPGIAHHVVQRGPRITSSHTNGRDFQAYIELLHDNMLKFGLVLHAYVLLEDRIHLLLTPSREDAISLALDRLTPQFGWYQVIGGDNAGFALTCLRYIEAVPVVLRLVDRPEAYYWSSARCNILGCSDELLTPHSAYLALGASPALRRRGYVALLTEDRDPNTAVASPRERVFLGAVAGRP